jgi:hypothetical protein
VGPHGAGLTHLLFLLDWACVVELKSSDDSWSKHHYANLAAWRGLTYGTSSPMGTPPPPAMSSTP